jgi:CRISPR-associated protein Csb2
MSFVVEVRLLTGRYDAGSAGDPALPEWPPHPGRLFSALVSAARSDAEWEALRWLERQEAPAVEASPATAAPVRRSYVVTNRVAARGGSQTHPGRTNQLRTRAGVTPQQPTARFIWQQATPDPDLARTLDGLCGRVPYFGRSTSIVTLVTLPEAGSDGVGVLDTWESSGIVDAESMLRVPFPGSVDALRAAHAADQPSWQVARLRGYRMARAVEPTPPAEAPSPYTDFVILRFVGVYPDGRLAVRFTEALRRAVMSRVRNPLPPVLHGHDLPGRPHVAFLALPYVGYQHADGHLLGLAVAVPRTGEPERRQILGGVLAKREPEDVFPLRVPGIGSVHLRYEPGLVRPYTLSPERWRRGSRRWVSATPVVLDRYPRRGDFEAEVVRGLRTAGLPAEVEIVSVETSPAPLQAGGIRLLPRELPDFARGRPFRHVAVTFDRRVAGPVLVGAGRYLGVGLLTPTADGPPASVAARGAAFGEETDPTTAVEQVQ